MGGLLDGLSLATGSLAAQQTALEVVGQNMANVNTPGYSRRVVNFVEVPLADGGGADIASIQGVRDEYVNAQLRNAQASASQDTATGNALSTIEAALGQAGSSVDAQLSQFFDGFAALAADPTSPEARNTVVSNGQALAAGLNQMSAALASADTQSDLAVTQSVAQINALSSQIASLNQQIASAGSTNVEAQIDQRDAALSSLSNLVGIGVVSESNGTVDVTVGSGRALVQGGAANALATTPAAGTGASTVLLDGQDITSEITGGSLGSAIQVRSELVPSYQTTLDSLAYSLGSAVNTQQEAGFDANGTAGEAFFSLPGSAAGAAAQIAVNPDLAADSELVAASSTGSAGDNQIAAAIAALRTSRISPDGGSTATDMWAGLVAQVGSDAQAAQSSQQSQQALVQQLGTLQGQVSGVSIDEEASNLMKYQRAYEASAQYFQTLNTTLDRLMDMVN